MKLLFVIQPEFNPLAGGVQKTTYELGKFFVGHGVEVSYFSWSNGSHLQSKFGQLYVAPHAQEVRNKKNRDYFRQLVSVLAPDVIINQMPYDIVFRRLLNRITKHKEMVTIACLHNSLFSFKDNIMPFLREKFTGYLSFLNNRISAAAMMLWHWLKHRWTLNQIMHIHDKFVVLTPNNIEEMEYFVGTVDVNKVSAIPNSISSITCQRIEKKKVILHVGRLNITQKRSDLLPVFWEKAMNGLPEWEFNIVGDGPYLDSLKQYVNEKGLQRINLLGRQEPNEFYKEASVFIMPSAYEGFPNTILEAQSFGCPVVAFNSYSALKWITNDGEDAILAHPYDVEEMAQKTIDLCHNEDKLLSMRENAIKNAQRFNIEHIGNTWLNLFEILVRERA